jgi:hypothetical protein
MTMAPTRFFPNPQQLQLLKFCLLVDADEARQAWKEWRAGVDLDDLDPACFRLMSLVYRRMMELGIEDRDAARIKGLHRYHWTRNQIAWRGKDCVLRALAEKGIPTVLLKGAALSRTVYPEPATRGMHDLDILVPVACAVDAMALLAGLGWVAQHFDAVRTIEHFHACSFLHPEFGELDLHWHVLRSCCQTERDDEMWAAAVDLPVDGIATKILCPPDQLLNACEHGMHPSPASSLQWLVDATFIIRHSPAPFDWTRLIDQARKVRLVLAARRSLHFIRKQFEPSIPREVLARLDAIPVSALDRVEYFLAGRSEKEHEKLSIRLGVALCHFLKLKHQTSWVGIIRLFLIYFRLLSHERRSWPAVLRDEICRLPGLWWDKQSELGFRLRLFLRGQRAVGGPVARMRVDHLRAFYKVERGIRCSWRWSEPDASLDLIMPPETCFLRLQLHPFRDLSRLEEDGLAFQFNGHPLPLSSFKIKGGGRFMTCRLDAAWMKPEGRQTLAWIIRPLRPPADSRILGLPLACLWIYRDRKPTREPCAS